MIFQRINPIIINEMRSRMRGRRAFVFITLYLIVLSLLASSIYLIVYQDNISGSAYNIAAPNVQYGPAIGKSIFIGSTMLLLTIISFIAPAFTAGAITGERERKTYEMLIVTPMQASRIVWGKLGAVFFFLVLLIMTTLPIQSMAFLFGGVALPEILISSVGLLVTALAFGAFGLYISSLVRTTMVSIILVYAISIPFLFGLPLFLGYFVAAFGSFFAFTNNPSIIAIGVLVYGFGFLLSINPFSAAIMTGVMISEGKGYFFFKETVGSTDMWFVSPWLVYVLFYSLLTLLLVFLTVRRTAKISHR